MSDAFLTHSGYCRRLFRKHLLDATELRQLNKALTFSETFPEKKYPLWLKNRTRENRTGGPRPLDWTLSWALLWTPSWDVSWELWWESLKGFHENREIDPRGSCRGRSRGRPRGRTRGSSRGPLVVPLVDPLVGRGSLSPALCVAHLVSFRKSRRINYCNRCVHEPDC